MARSSFTRWHAAGWARRVLPDRRGRDRLLSLIQGSSVPASLAGHETALSFGPGLVATVPLDADGAFVDLFFAAYQQPVLVPVLDACLAPGDCFVDVGANIGIYSLWSSRLVGSSGTVVAFEPVPSTRRWLEALRDQNDAAIEVRPEAVSDAAGSVLIETVPSASYISRIRADLPADAAGPSHAPSRGDVTMVEVTTIALDDALAARPGPTLVKIDVEGHELSVFRGMRTILDEQRPAVVFECPDTVEASGDTGRILQLLDGHGYQVWSLTPHGLQVATGATASHNLLALHPAVHSGIRERLATTRFARNQNF